MSSRISYDRDDFWSLMLLKKNVRLLALRTICDPGETTVIEDFEKNPIKTSNAYSWASLSVYPTLKFYHRDTNCVCYCYKE